MRRSSWTGANRRTDLRAVAELLLLDLAGAFALLGEAVVVSSRNSAMILLRSSVVCAARSRATSALYLASTSLLCLSKSSFNCCGLAAGAGASGFFSGVPLSAGFGAASDLVSDLAAAGGGGGEAGRLDFSGGVEAAGCA